MRKLKLFLDAKAANTPPRGISKASRVIFSVLTLLLLSVGNVWGADETITFSEQSYENAQAITAVNGTDFSITFAKGTNNNAPKYYASGTSIRAYGGNTFTVSSSTKTIAKIELGFGSSDGSNAITTDVDTYDNGTWEGSATSITFTIGGTSGNRRLASVAVTYEEEDTPPTPTCAVPTFDPEDGEMFSESVDVAIAAEDGATIYYTTNGETPTTSSSVYSSTLNFTETTTVKAIAVKEGSNNSAVASATYTKTVIVSSYAIDFETANLASYVNWDFSNIAIVSTAISAHGGTYYGNTDGKASASITTKAKVASPGTLTFYISKESNNTTASSWKAQVSSDGTEWTDVETFDAKSMSKGAWNECSADLSAHSNVYVRIAYSGSTAIRAIDDIELAMASDVAKPTISGDENFVTSTTVTISHADADHIYYTTNGDAPTTSSTLYSAPFEVNATTTIKAIAVKGSDESDVAEKTFTKQTVLTVAEALVEATGSGKYVTGTITSIIEVNIGYKNATYVISDISAGVPQNEMIVYRGKYIGGADFTSADQIHVGDVVLVSGSLTQYNQKNQMAQGNQIETISAAAVAAPEFTPNGGGFMGETDVTITCATGSSTIYYTLDGTNPTKSSTLYEGAIHLNTTTTITAIAYVGEESSLVVAKEFTLTAPMTVADAYDALTGDDINNAAVAGIVYQVDNISNGHATYWISDNGEAGEKVLEVYNGYGLNGASIAAGGIQVGDEVTVFGNLTIYVKNATSTKEFAAGSRLLAFNRPVVAVTDIDLTESTAEVEVGKTVTLHASVVPANATNKTIVWSVQSGNDKAEVDANGVVTGIAAGEAVVRAAAAADENIYAECTVTVTEPAPLSPWASVYTSNVTLSTEGGTSASAAKVKFYGEEGDGYDAIKAGTSSAQGAVVVNVPAGATALHFHAYSWYNETVELTVTAPTGVTVTPSEAIAINKNSGISGSSSTYTLAEGSDPKTDAYYAVSLSGNTEPVALTISATSGKRFVLFGVNQEGGLVLESIAISGTASVLEYNDGDHFDPAGLVVTGHYSNGSDAPISEGIDWAFDPDPLTEGTESVSVTATVGEISSDAFVVNGLIVHGAAPLSPWASVYTSNVEIASNTAAHVTINEENFDAAKTSKGASATIILPQGVTTIHLHLVAWNGEAQTVSVTGDCFNDAKELAIEANAGVSGQGTTYNLGASGVDYYFSLTPDNEVAANTVITIAAEGQKRFVLFGVNQEGGIVPVLDRIEISGDLTNKSGYKAGDALDLEGLTVNAIYTLNEVEQDPVDVTADVEWSYDALVENQTEVTITATYKGQIDDITITGLDPVASADPVIYVQPSLNVNFGTVAKDASVDAKQITVTLQNVAAATATLGGTNPEAFSIDDTEIADGDVITISVASTATLGNYSATITITDNEGLAPQKVVNISLTVEGMETPVSTTSQWVAATDADLVDGAEVLITGVTGGVTYAIGVQNDNNRAAVAGTLSEGVFTPGENTMSFTLVAQEEEGVFALQASNGEYLYAASSSKNYLKRQATLDDNAKWTLTATSAVANGSNTHNDLKFNATNNPKIFSCYASGQTAIQFYVEKQETPEPPVVDYTEVRNGLTEGWYYTMCLDKAVTAVKAGSIWRVLSKAANGNDVILEEVIGTLDAGRPYIFRAAASTLEVAYTGDAVGAPVNDEDNNGLVGSFTEELLAQNPNHYIIYNNALYYVNSDNVKVGAHRAYLNMTGVPAYSNEPQQGAPRRRVTMAVYGEQTATGVDAINATDAPVKMMINGQMYILRGEKMYDTTGRLVK